MLLTYFVHVSPIMLTESLGRIYGISCSSDAKVNVSEVNKDKHHSK